MLDGLDVVAETKNGSTTNYIRGASGIISSSIQGTNNTTKYYLSDGHGNITNLTDVSGGMVNSYTYGAFGVEENPSDSDTNPFRYCGEYYDSEIEQIYLRARYYDPSLGRFTSLDAYWNTEDIIYGKTEIKSLNDLNKINEELSNAKNGEKLESEDLKKEQKVIQNNIRKIYLDQSKSSEEKEKKFLDGT